MGKKSKAPKPPDLVAAANAQAILNRNAATDVMNANRYTQVGPEGSSNQWITDPATGAVTNKTTMGAQPQALYDALMGNATSNIGTFQDKYWSGGGGSVANVTPTQSYGGGGVVSYGVGSGVPSGYGSVSGGGSSRGGIPGGIYAPDKLTGTGGVGGDIQRDIDYSGLGVMPTVDEAARQQVQDALYKQQAQYLDPQYDRSQAALAAKLSNQGLVPGTAAYNNAMRIENDARQKAYGDARLQAITGGGAEQQRLLEMGLALRNQGKSEVDSKGTFHNAAQDQRARQLLTDIGQQRSLEGSLAGANATVSAAGINASTAAQTAANRLALDTRAQEYQEAMGMGAGANAFLPQFGISQGNMQPYKPADIYGATQDAYGNAMAQYKANQSSGWTSMIPGVGKWLGNSSLGKAIPGMVGSYLGIGV